MSEPKQAATMQLPMDLIAPAIQAHVNSAVIEALKGSDQLISKLVSEICGQQVDSDGNPKGYGTKMPWLHWVTQGIVRDAIKSALKEHLAASESKIKKAIEAEVKRSNSKIVSALVNGMSTGIAEKLSSEYRCKIDFSIT